ncbi:hypothetical protein AcV5_004429 [Taiwanofungus camphoratus]|nr:hypothetical protein AcV5_004429 [Antrodia cinnamomea]
MAHAQLAGKRRSAAISPGNSPHDGWGAGQTPDRPHAGRSARQVTDVLAFSQLAWHGGSSDAREDCAKSTRGLYTQVVSPRHSQWEEQKDEEAARPRKATSRD